MNKVYKRIDVSLNGIPVGEIDADVILDVCKEWKDFRNNLEPSTQQCPECKEMKDDVRERRQNTRYVKDELNYVVLCKDCFKDRQEYWKEMWRGVW